MSEGRTDDPIPFDLFSTAGRVTVRPPAGEIHIPGPDTIAKVYKPDGKLLNTTGTTTSGLQEAFAYAAANNLDVLIFGRGVRNANPFSQFGYFSVNSPLTIGALHDRTYEIYSVTFNYTRTTGNVLTLSDMVNSRFELTGQIVAVLSNGAGVLIRPVATGVLNSQIRIQHVVGQKVPFATNVVIDPGLQTIENSEFHLQEMNAAYFGITVANPSASTYFRNNFIRSQHIHAFGHIGLQLGQSEANASRIQGNRLQIRANNDGVGGGGAEAAMQVWGHSNFINLIVLGSGLNFGVKFEPSSTDNTLYYTSLLATTPIANYGTNNQFTSGPPSDIYGPSGGGGSAALASTMFNFTAALETDVAAAHPIARVESPSKPADLLLTCALRSSNREKAADAAFAALELPLGDSEMDGHGIDLCLLDAAYDGLLVCGEFDVESVLSF